jgi:hypothetical protein
MHLTRGGSVQRPLTSGPRGWPAGPTLPPLMGWLHGLALQEAVTRNPKLEVRHGGHPAMWLGRLANTWHITNLIKSVTPPWTPINTPYRWNSRHHTLLVVLHMERSWFTSSTAGEALSGVKSRVKALLELCK